MATVLDYLPRGNLLSDAEWSRRHRFLQWVLVAHPPAIVLIAIALGHDLPAAALVVAPVLVCLGLSFVSARRRLTSFFVTAGLVYSSAALVWAMNGAIEAHFHFFIIIGFIALYQDWVPFIWNILFTVVSHGLGSAFQRDLIFNHPAAQDDPWLWSAIHGVAVLAACAGMVIYWRVSEDEQNARQVLAQQLTDAEIGRRKFTSELLVNLARRNQTMLYRQLDIINQLEEKEQDPDALADLFRLDHLATRVRRNAESLLVLSGEEQYRVWSAPVPLHDAVRAAVAETEHLDRVEMSVGKDLSIAGHAVTDLTHLLAELTENAVRFSPPDADVVIRTRRHTKGAGGQLLTIEDYGVGMPPEALDAANRLLTAAPEVDLSVSRQLGFHVVARLASRHGITVSLSPTPGSGITAAVLLPAELLAGQDAEQPELVGSGAPGAPGAAGRQPWGPAEPERAFHGTPSRAASHGGVATAPPPAPSAPAMAGLDTWDRPGSGRPFTPGAPGGNPAGFGVAPATPPEWARPAAFADPPTGTGDGYGNGFAGGLGDGFGNGNGFADGLAGNGVAGNGHHGNGHHGNGSHANGSHGVNGNGSHGAGHDAWGVPAHDLTGHANGFPTEELDLDRFPIDELTGRTTAESDETVTSRRWPGWWEAPGSDHLASAASAASPDAPATHTTAHTTPHTAPWDAAPSPAETGAQARPETAAPQSGAPGERPAPRLTRRVPQTHLAPELRRPRADDEPAAPASPNAPDALSRYQASRRAAQSAEIDTTSPWDHGRTGGQQ